MEFLAGSASADLNIARSTLGEISPLIESALLHLNSVCSVDGRLSPALLDEHQLASYDISFCVAEQTASRNLLDYAAAIVEQDGLAAGVACQFVAESIKSIIARLSSRPADYGLSRKMVAAALEQSDASGLAEFYLTASRMASLGAQLISREGDYLPANLDEEKLIIRDTFRRFATDVVMPLAEDIHRQDLDVPEDILQPLREMGCFGISIPERFGGLQPDEGDDSLYMILVTEELSRGSLGAAGSLITRPEILARALVNGGTEDQKKHWLPKVASGETLVAIALTEPDYGSDLASAKLKATKTEGGWLLNGAKTWCTFAGSASVMLTLARTGTESDGHKGLSFFLVEKPRTEGHQFDVAQEGSGRLIGKAIPTLGYRGMHSFDVSFEDYFVADTNLVGEEAGIGKGFYYAMAGLTGGRMQTSARAAGIMQAACEQATNYAKDRKVFAQPVADYQLTLVKLSRMITTLLASRQFSYEVAREVDAGGGKMAASLVKLFACRSAEWVTREALQIHGGMGYAEEVPVSRYFVDARVLSIFEGAEETLALKVISRELIANASAGQPQAAVG
ncbi:MAG: acyl-CoA dehydrogenase [Gammaproteobacteria bacterium]|nr:MAG: acyl-CoA dehydrogenase [Gammaproteobacteria bacterium]